MHYKARVNACVVDDLIALRDINTEQWAKFVFSAANMSANERVVGTQKMCFTHGQLNNSNMGLTGDRQLRQIRQIQNIPLDIHTVYIPSAYDQL